MLVVVAVVLAPVGLYLFGVELLLMLRILFSPKTKFLEETEVLTLILQVIRVVVVVVFSVAKGETDLTMLVVAVVVVVFLIVLEEDRSHRLFSLGMEVAVEAVYMGALGEKLM